MATISARKDIESFPAVNLVSYSDGLLGNGSGIPYLYLTTLDFTAKDLAVSISVTLLLICIAVAKIRRMFNITIV